MPDYPERPLRLVKPLKLDGDLRFVAAGYAIGTPLCITGGVAAATTGEWPLAAMSAVFAGVSLLGLFNVCSQQRTRDLMRAIERDLTVRCGK